MDVQNYAQAVVAAFIPWAHNLCMDNLARIRDAAVIVIESMAVNRQ